MVMQEAAEMAVAVKMRPAMSLLALGALHIVS
jgi:hypothetical protein